MESGYWKNVKLIVVINTECQLSGRVL